MALSLFAGIAGTARTAQTNVAQIIDGLKCIHHYEGAWNSNTGNGYYGGLQMDYSFQRTYGSEFLKMFGTADKWPVFVQMSVGIRAYYHRGWHPWPNTARRCGLI